MSEQSKEPLSAKPVVSGHVYKIFPNDLNAHGTVFGGCVMAECDRLALVIAERYSGNVCVTASVDSIHFMAPAREGDTLVFFAAVNKAWRSSMEIGIRVEAENSYTRDVRHIVSAYFTFVALDENNKPVNVPEFIPANKDEERRAKEADIRRSQRLKTRDAIDSHRTHL